MLTANLLSIVGLLLTSASAIWLAVHDFRQRTRQGNKSLRRDELVSHRDAMLRRYQEVRTNLENANRSLDPTGQRERYPVEQMTNAVRADFEAAERKLTEAEGALQESTADAWPQPVHFGAFVLLLVGFLCQLGAEILKLLPTTSL